MKALVSVLSTVLFVFHAGFSTFLISIFTADVAIAAVAPEETKEEGEEDNSSFGVNFGIGRDRHGNKSVNFSFGHDSRGRFGGGGGSFYNPGIGVADGDFRLLEMNHRLLELVEGNLGALIMISAGIAAIISAAFGAYRAAIGLLVVAVGAFILRSMVDIFFDFF